MPFTNVDLVKKHLLQHQVGLTERENVLLKLSGITAAQLPDRNLVVNSEKVKGKEQIVPTQQTVDFASGDTVQLPDSELIPETAVLAKDSSLGTIYVENVDYHLDYESGKISRLSSGTIPSASEVVIWYLYFRVYQKGTDYSMDYGKGEVTRLASGAIEDGQWVFVDYQVEFGFYSDDLIANAIVEADAQMISKLDSAYLESEEQNLISAQTYWAISILCNSKSLEALNQNLPGSQAKALSESWAVMAKVYRKQAEDLLRLYIMPFSQLDTPVKVQNES
jgi:hypothetical protein